MNTTRVLRTSTGGLAVQTLRSMTAAGVLRAQTRRAICTRHVSCGSAACQGAMAMSGGGRAIAPRAMRGSLMAAGGAAVAGSALLGWKTCGSIAECASDDVIGDDAYEPGQAVGVGIKAEMWKTKHPNLTILETAEDTPVLGLLSVVRNDETEGGVFYSAANRLMRQLLDAAVMGLPSDEEAVFVTPARVMMKGVLPEEDLQVCAISLHLEHEQSGVFDAELKAVFPTFERGSLRVRGLTRGSGKELPRDMGGKQVLLLAPVVGYAQPVLAALERLEQAGVEDENVTLVSVVMSKEAVETITEEAGDMSVVCAAMDGETRGFDHQVVPGVGDFSRRYFEAKDIVDAEATAKRKADKDSGRRGWRFWARGD